MNIRDVFNVSIMLIASSFALSDRGPCTKVHEADFRVGTGDAIN